MEEKKVNQKQIQELIEQFIDIIGYAIDINLEPDEESGGYKAQLNGENLGVLIGYHGKNISSIEHIINLMIVRKYGIGTFVNIDINEYRKVRLDNIKKYVESTIKKIEKSHESYTLYPMSPYERLFVHKLVKEHGELETLSSGEEPNRSITITFKE